MFCLITYHHRFLERRRRRGSKRCIVHNRPEKNISRFCANRIGVGNKYCRVNADSLEKTSQLCNNRLVTLESFSLCLWIRSAAHELNVNGQPRSNILDSFASTRFIVQSCTTPRTTTIATKSISGLPYDSK